jgi:ribosomal protein L40E
MKQCTYCGRENPDEANFCQECGTAELKHFELKAPEAQIILYFLATNDHEGKLWSPQEADAAKQLLTERFNRIPTLEDLYLLFRKEPTDDSIRRLLKERQEYIDAISLLSVDIPKEVCHKCGCRGEVYTFPFGLGKIISYNTDWSSTVVSSAISAALLPLCGIGICSMPSAKQRIRYLKLTLQLCSACCLQLDKGFWGRIKLQHSDYAFHPQWNFAARCGFTLLVNSEELKNLQESNDRSVGDIPV